MQDCGVTCLPHAYRQSHLLLMTGRSKHRPLNVSQQQLRERETEQSSAACPHTAHCTHHTSALPLQLSGRKHTPVIFLRLLARSRRMLRLTDGAVVFKQELGGEYSNDPLPALRAEICTDCVCVDVLLLFFCTSNQLTC